MCVEVFGGTVLLLLFVIGSCWGVFLVGGGIYMYKQVLVTKKNGKDKTFFKYLGDKDAMNRSI